jgi:hypothetical protein
MTRVPYRTSTTYLRIYCRMSRLPRNAPLERHLSYLFNRSVIEGPGTTRPQYSNSGGQRCSRCHTHWFDNMTGYSELLCKAKMGPAWPEFIHPISLCNPALIEVRAGYIESGLSRIQPTSAIQLPKQVEVQPCFFICERSLHLR